MSNSLRFLGVAVLAIEVHTSGGGGEVLRVGKPAAHALSHDFIGLFRVGLDELVGLVETSDQRFHILLVQSGADSTKQSTNDTYSSKYFTSRFN